MAHHYDPADVNKEHCLYMKDLIQFLRGDAFYDTGRIQDAVQCWYQSIIFPNDPTPRPPLGKDDYRPVFQLYDRGIIVIGVTISQLIHVQPSR